jgi:excisionase family DNA binding protein
MKTIKNELYTIKQASEETGYSAAHLRKLVRIGKIKAIKPNGGKVFIPGEALDAFLNGKVD